MAVNLRKRIVSRLEASVRRRGYPRTAVALAIALAAVSSLILSIVLLRWGLTHMGVRYFLCAAFGYGVFLVFLRFLVSRQFHELDPGLDLLSPRDFADRPPLPSGGGGEFGGAGASGNWSDGSALTSSSTPTDSDAIGGGIPDVDLDEGWVIAIPLIILGSGVLAVGYIVVIAPVLVAEIVLDLAIAAGAYRGVIRSHRRPWPGGAFRRTRLAALGLVVFVAIGGSALQAAAPAAHTIGAAIMSL